ncbi:MAG: ion channel [Myxococcota bacterium]
MSSPLQPSSDEFELEGVPRTPFADAYHIFLRAPLWLSIVMIVGFYLLVNAAFAVLFWLTGGIAHASGSFVDAFFFSVQTMGTIGYGSMYPETPLAHALVTAEAVAGLLITAISTGLVFAKISLPGARIQFSEKATISPMNGLPTLQIRVGNQRANMVVEPEIRLVLTRFERTTEGVAFYRMHDLKLERGRSPTLTRTWTVLHRITPESPLWGASQASLKESESELVATVTGTDDTTLQPVHAGIRYSDDDIVFGMRPTDVLSMLPNGRLLVDLRNFHGITPADPVVWELPESILHE